MDNGIIMENNEEAHRGQDGGCPEVGTVLDGNQADLRT